MSIWTVLGIERTTDIKEIKRAYSALMSKYHPEEYPEKFSEIQEAYNKAIKYAKANKTVAPPTHTMQYREINHSDFEIKPLSEGLDFDTTFSEQSNSFDNSVNDTNSVEKPTLNSAFNEHKLSSDEKHEIEQNQTTPASLNQAFNEHKQANPITEADIPKYAVNPDFNTEFNQSEVNDDLFGEFNNISDLDTEDEADKFYKELRKLAIFQPQLSLMDKSRTRTAIRTYLLSEGFYCYADKAWFYNVFTRYLSDLASANKFYYDSFVKFARTLVSDMPSLVKKEMLEVLSYVPPIQTEVPKNNKRLVAHRAFGLMFVLILALRFGLADFIFDMLNGIHDIGTSYSTDYDIPETEYDLSKFTYDEIRNSSNNYYGPHGDLLANYYKDIYGENITVFYLGDVAVPHSNGLEQMSYEYQVTWKDDDGNINEAVRVYIPIYAEEEMANLYIERDEILREIIFETADTLIGGDTYIMPYEFYGDERTIFAENELFVGLTVGYDDDTLINFILDLETEVWQNSLISEDLITVYLQVYDELGVPYETAISVDIVRGSPLNLDELEQMVKIDWKNALLNNV